MCRHGSSEMGLATGSDDVNSSGMSSSLARSRGMGIPCDGQVAAVATIERPGCCNAALSVRLD